MGLLELVGAQPGAYDSWRQLCFAVQRRALPVQCGPGWILHLVLQCTYLPDFPALVCHDWGRMAGPELWLLLPVLIR